MPKKPIVIGIGEVLWDLLPNRKFPGGAPINFAFHAQQLGASAFPISAVGNDALGVELIDQLSAAGLRTDYIARCNKPTGTVSVTLDDNGVPAYTIHEDVAWDRIPWDEPKGVIAPKADAVCFGSLAQRSPTSKATIIGFLKATSRHCIRILDLNLRQQFYSKGLVEESLLLCNTLKVNTEEMGVVCSMLRIGGNELEMAKALVSKYSLRLLALTQGEKGSLLVTPNDYSYKRTPRVDVVDTIGAGDSFTAALAVGLLTGKSLEDTHEMAILLSSYVCSQRGAMPPIPSDMLKEMGLRR